MKKLIIALMLGVLVTSGFSQDRTGLIRSGGNIMNKLSFTVADSIITSDSLVIAVTNINKYLQHQSLAMTLDDVDGGSPSIVVTLRGAYTSGGDLHPIGTPVTWTGEGSNPIEINSTTALNYNYFKVSLVASGAAQHARVLTMDFRTANVYDIGASSAYVFGNGSGTVQINSSDWDISTTGVMTGIGAITSNGLITGSLGATISGATTSLNAASNFATNLNTGSSTGALSLGGGSGTVAVNSSVWDVTTAGVASGLKQVTVTADADNVILDPYKDLEAIDVQINSASKFSVDTTGNVTAAGLFKGGLQLVNVITNTDESESLTALQSGTIVTFDGAGTATIPDPSAATIGVVYYLIQTADANLTVTATTANNNAFVCDHVATSDSVAITTASHRLAQV